MLIQCMRRLIGNKFLYNTTVLIIGYQVNQQYVSFGPLKRLLFSYLFVTRKEQLVKLSAISSDFHKHLTPKMWVVRLEESILCGVDQCYRCHHLNTKNQIVVSMPNIIKKSHLPIYQFKILGSTLRFVLEVYCLAS